MQKIPEELGVNIFLNGHLNIYFSDVTRDYAVLKKILILWDFVVLSFSILYNDAQQGTNFDL